MAIFGQHFQGCKTRKTYFLGSDTPPTNSGKLTERGSSPTYFPHLDESHGRLGVNKNDPKMNKSEQILSWCSPRCPTLTFSTAKKMRIFGILSSDGCVDEVISSTHLSQIGLDHQWWLFTERIQRMGEQNVLQEDIPWKGIGIHQHVVDLTSQPYRCLKIGRPPTRGSYYMAPLVDGRNPAPVPVNRQLIPFFLGLETVAEIKTRLNTHLFHSTLCRSVSGFGVWLSHDTPFWNIVTRNNGWLQLWAT